jgi:energy-coupling factor transporter ATP-binding protein EcfA2
VSRQTRDWVRDFVEWSEPFNTGELFREWGALWMLSTAVGRQCGTKLRGQLLTPNMFILLIGGPGSGKSQAVSSIRQVLLASCKISLVPSSITRAGLQDYMQENLQTRKAPDGTLTVSNECIALSEEMQGILPEHDIGHLTLYNELYDVRSVYKAQTRSHGKVDLQSPYCSIITGAQPAFLSSQLPEQAWGMGFMSRSIMVFDLPRERSSAFKHKDVNHALQTRLVTDLKRIHQLAGYYTWSPEAMALYETWWVDQGGPPEPQAKRLKMGYNSRRDLHFFKLAMAFSLSRGDDLRVEKEDARRAIELLIRTEGRMKHIFTEMAATGAMVAIADILDVVKNRTMEGAFTAESDLIAMLTERFQPTQVYALIENLIQSKQIKDVSKIGAKGFREFVTGDRLSRV